jgi:hypothetical protein
MNGRREARATVGRSWGGPFDGRDPRDIVAEAIEWLREYLDSVEALADELRAGGRAAPTGQGEPRSGEADSWADSPDFQPLDHNKAPHANCVRRLVMPEARVELARGCPRWILRGMAGSGNSWPSNASH